MGHTTSGVELFMCPFLQLSNLKNQEGDGRMIKINGKEAANAEGKTILEYMEEHGIRNEYVAVEWNTQILSKEEYKTRLVEDGDIIEIVSFVGGG